MCVCKIMFIVICVKEQEQTAKNRMYLSVLNLTNFNSWELNNS